MALFVDERLTEARGIVDRYPEGRERSAIMPLLYLAQSIEGHVSRDALREVADLLGLATAEVEAVATFYTMYRLRPTGTHVVSVCTNLACCSAAPATSTRPPTRPPGCATVRSSPRTG